MARASLGYSSAFRRTNMKLHARASLALLVGMALEGWSSAHVGRELQPAAPLQQVAADLRVQVVLEGLVYEPDGTPAVGAMVVSSAGGKAVTDGDGWDRLALEVPFAAESVQVTAVGAGGRTRLASQTVSSIGAGRAPVDPLFLAQDTACSPSWLPTFG